MKNKRKYLKYFTQQSTVIMRRRLLQHTRHSSYSSQHCQCMDAAATITTQGHIWTLSMNAREDPEGLKLSLCPFHSFIHIRLMKSCHIANHTVITKHAKFKTHTKNTQNRIWINRSICRVTLLKSPNY